MRWKEWLKKYGRIIGYVMMVAYGVLRALPLFWAFELGQWDIVVFFIIDFSTVVTQIYCMEKFFRAVGVREAIAWTLGVLASFFAPYVYALLRGESPPDYAYYIMVAIIVFAASVTIFKERKRLRNRVRHSRPTAASE